VLLIHQVPPGEYRIRLAPQWGGQQPLQQPLELTPFAVNLEDFFSRDVPQDNGPSVPAGRGATVELRGVLDGQDSDPKFSLILTLPDGTERREQFRLGDKLYGDWIISEFSPAHNTITLYNGEKLLIVERGTPETIH